MTKMRDRETVSNNGIDIETYVDGEGSTLVILPSYGRDGGEDFDDLAARLAGAGWKVLRPQPRGIAGSKGPMSGLTMHDLANDVIRCIQALGEEHAVLLGHAFGQALSRVVTTDHPKSVKAVVLAAAEASKIPDDIANAPFVAGDLSKPEYQRLAVLRKAFFAPNHDARIWLRGWYPDTLKMQHEAAKATDLKASSACGKVPLLEIIPEYDPFIPKANWNEMRDELGDRVTTAVIKDASHALFPEQPDRVAEAVLPWIGRFK